MIKLRSFQSRLYHIASSQMGSVKKTRTSAYEKLVGAPNGILPDETVDLRSDTLTKPSKAMRLAMAEAEVGDDVLQEDPTVREFETRVASIFGKPGGIFTTSGAMGNLISALIHCNERGSEMIVGNESHMFLYEQGSASQFGGIHSNQIANNENGTFDIDGVLDRIQPDDIHLTRTKLIAVENTHSMCGGRVMPLEWLDELGKCAKEHNIRLHMDGARVFNASIASGIPVSRIVKDFDSVSICFSKGLGAPVGGILVGDLNFIEKARRMRKALGGGMRQSGILAAGGLYCLDHMIDRLKDDHENAKIIAKIINSIKSPYVFVNYDEVESNIIMLNVLGFNITDFCKRLITVEEKEREEIGCLVSVKFSPKTHIKARLVTHVDISQEMAIRAAEKICYVTKEFTEKIK